MSRIRHAGLLAVVLMGAAVPRRADAQYTESFQTWSATSADTWQTKDLAASPFSVPANAVVEIAVRNASNVFERSGGVRAVGSSLDRRLLLMEGESNGDTFLVMHVQTDASSDIQHYSDGTNDVTFILLGYWTSGTYVERFDAFTAGASAAWTDKSLCSYGVRPGWVAEVVMTNDDPANARSMGVRSKGSALDRRVTVNAPVAGGVSTAMMFVKADSAASARVQLYAQDDADVDFYLAGYWSVAPRAYTELITDIGSPSADATWEDKDLTASGVPDSAVTEFVLSNRDTNDGERTMGVRTNGSALARLEGFHKAQVGGGDVGRMHVASDGGAVIEFYHSDVSQAHTFYLSGYWTSCDTSISYSVTDLGAITSTKSSLGYHINSAEKIAGFEEDASGDSSAWYTECGTLTSLGTLGGSYAEAQGINDADMVVGWSHNASEKRRAFRWTSGGGMVDLGTVSGRTDSEALSVNGNSEIVGTVMDFGSPPNDRLAFLYLPSAAYGLGSGMNSLGTLGGTQSVAMDINDSGQVTGGAQNASGNFRPFRWANGAFTNLGTLGGESSIVDHRGEAINGSGDVAGRSYTAAEAGRAFFWNGVTMSDLGVLTGGSNSTAFGVNDSDVVVGTSDVTGGAYRAFVWDGTNGMRNLNSLISGGSGWTLIRATDINNDGFITGWGTNGSGDTRAFLLTPTCNAGGGGAASILASGSGTTDAQGNFEETVLDVDGELLAEIEVMTARPEVPVEYEVFAPAVDARPEPSIDDEADGFADGVSLARTLKLAMLAAADDAVVGVNMLFRRDEIAEVGAAAEELELHVFDPERSKWAPAGSNVGERASTMIVGQSGMVLRDRDTVEYWGVRDSGGTFRVGKPLAVEPADAPTDDPPAPRPRVCGVGLIAPVFLILLVLLPGGPARRRRKAGQLLLVHTPRVHRREQQSVSVSHSPPVCTPVEQTSLGLLPAANASCAERATTVGAT